MASTNQPARNLGGRPEVGPAFSVRFPSDLLARVDEARGPTSRALWLRDAAELRLPSAGETTIGRMLDATDPRLRLAAALLLATVAEDRTRMGLHSLPAPADLAAEIENANANSMTICVAGILRYLLSIDGVAEIERLCTAPDCDGESLGRGPLTRICVDHLDVPVPGLLPLAGDDVRPQDLEAAAQESRRMRLDAWGEEIEALSRSAAGDRRYLDSLRAAETSST